jgi:carbon storage regulator
MLILHRRVGQRIVLTGGIEITVSEISRGGVRLAVTAPPGVAILRGEVHDAVVAANHAAAASFGEEMSEEAAVAEEGE